MIRRLIILLLIVGCGTEPQDCAGVEGGTAELDNCNVCDSDPTNDCVQDCDDVWGGDAVVDCMGECGGIYITDLECSFETPNPLTGELILISFIIPCGMYPEDCISPPVCDGAVLDECGICGGDGSTCN